MTIRKLLFRNSLFVAVLLVFAIAGQLVLDHLQSKEMRKKEATEQIAREVSGLVLLTNEWSAFHYERIYQQWELKQKRVKQLMAENETEYSGLIHEVDALEENFRALMSSGLQLKQEEMDPKESLILDRNIEWLVMRNQLNSQSIIDKTYEVSARVMNNLRSIQDVSVLLYIIFLVLISVVIFSFSRRVAARITKPLDTLKSEVGRFEKGDFSDGFDLEDPSSQIRSTQDTYILARAVNSMLETIRGSINKLENQKTYIQTILDNIPLGVAVSKIGEGEITYINHEFEKVYGSATTEISDIKSFFQQVSANNDSDKIISRIYQDIEDEVSGKRNWDNILVRSKTGEERIVNIQSITLPDLRLIIFTTDDVTPMKLIQMQLEESQKQLKNITDNLPGVVIQYKLDAKGKDELAFVSKGAEKIWGVSAEEAMYDNQKVWAQMDPNDAIYVRESIVESYNNLTTWKVEWRNILPDNSVRWFQGLGIPQKAEDGVVIWDSLILDVTDRKEAEIKLKEYQDSLKRLTTEISVSEERQRKEIAANIHDHLSQSLVISKMKLNDLMKNKKLSSYHSELKIIIKHISEALENSRKITYDLSPPVLYEMGLVETMYWLVENMEADSPVKMSFVSEFEVIEFDEASLILLFRSIQELIYNVLKHAEASNIELSFRKMKNQIEISIRDDGKGFDVFSVNDNKRNMSSFGLFAVKERLQNLGGSLKIESQPGNGTDAKIYVPLEVTKAYRYGD